MRDTTIFSGPRSWRDRPAPAPCTVADLMTTTLVKLPPWFEAAQAVRVARLRGVDHVLVEERGRLAGAVSVERLAGAPAHDIVGRWAQRTGASCTAETPPSDAAALLRAAGVDCLPVTRGGLLVGLVTGTILAAVTRREIPEAA